MKRPLILITNDDGIRSIGLRTVAAACADLASRQRYFYPIAPPRHRLDEPARLGMRVFVVPDLVEPDSDVYAVAIDKVISVTPLTNDLTTKTDFLAPSGWDGNQDI